MICSKCGCELEENAKFCSKCGEKVNNNEKRSKDKVILKPKNKRIIWYVVMGLILASAIIGIALTINYKKEMQAEKNKEEVAIQNMQKVLSSSSIDLKEYILEEPDIDNYNGLLNELKTALENKDVKSGEELITEIQEYITKINIESKNIILEKVQALENKDTGNAYDAENDSISQYSAKIDQLISEKKYVSALKDVNKWENICNLIETEGDYEIAVSQIDILEYPKIKLYLKISDMTVGDEVNIEQFENFMLMEKIDQKYVKKNIISALQLDETENLNINLVSDISGSMSEQFDDVKGVMRNFANYIQFDVGDKASLITFDNNISVDADFTSKKSILEKAINNMQLGNMTALYDALYVAVSKTSMQEGAKCVIAFTDGYDNDSIRSSDEVIELALTYKIPIFIIGIGDDLDNFSMSNIANMTGGFYENVNNGVSMQSIYNKIYRQQKQLYMLEYETDQSANDMLARNVYISYFDDTMAMRNTTSYIPATFKKEPDNYKELIEQSSISNNEIEDEILRIREIWNSDTKEMSKKKYQVTKIADGIVAYSKQGDIRMIEVQKNTNGISYARTYNFSNNKLIFAYIEAEDAHRLYFKDDILFRWRYTVDKNKKENAVNHDNQGDSDDFKQWQTFAVDEANKIYADAIAKIQ